jgi:hypothetical protein
MPYLYYAPLRGQLARAAFRCTQWLAQAGAAWLVLLVLLLPGAARAQAPTFSGAVSLNPEGLYGTSIGQATAVDAAGNQYVTGQFTGRIKIGATTLTASGSSDIYVAKRSAAGAWLWAVRAGGPGVSSLDYSYAIAADASGNALITGTMAGLATFDTQPTITTLPATSSNNIFVAKFGAADGVCAWAVQCPGPNSSVGQGIAADASGNAVVTGTLAGTVSFGTRPTATSLTSWGSNDAFVAKFGATDGACTWVVKAGGNSGDQGKGVGVDASGDILVAGTFFGSATFGTSPTATTLTSAGGTDMFVAKFGGAAGACLWAVRAGGSSTGNTAGDVAQSLALDAGGNALVAGYFTTSATFGTSPTATTLTSAGGIDMFVAKFGGAAGACAWAVRAGGTSLDQANSIAADASGNALVTGYFAGTATFGAGATPALTAVRGFDAFVAKFGAADGACAWATAGGGTYDDYGYGIAADASDNALVVGAFGNAASFGSAPEVFAPGTGLFVGQAAGSTGAWQATAQANDGSTSGGRAAATDAAGNQYVTGQFTGTLVLGGTTLTAAGGGDVYVAKRSAAGAWLWAARIGGPDFADNGYGLAVDAAGNALVTGYFSSTATFGAGPAAPTLTAAGSYDIYVAKFGAADGVCAWAVQAGGAGADIGQAIAVDAAGNALVTGQAGALSTFGTGPTAITLPTVNNGYDGFVAKFGAADGACAWALTIGSTGFDLGQGIVADAGGNALVTGYVGGLATVGAGPTAVALPFAGAIDVFVAKFDAATGTCAWAVTQGGTNSDIGEDIALDASGNIFVTGYFSATTSFATTPTATTLVSAGRSDVFVARFDAAAGACAWVVRAGGPDNDQGQGVGVDARGNVLVTGVFIGSATFATAPTATTLTAPSGSDGNDSFVARFGAAGGACAWAVGANTRDNGGSNGGNSIVADAGGGALLAGGFTGAASFGGTALVGGSNSTRYGPGNGFLVRLAPSGPVLTALTPASGVAGSTLAATGALLDGATAVVFTGSGGTAAAAPAGYVVASSTSLTGIGVPAGLAPGPYTLTVVTPVGTTNGLTYTVVAPVGPLPVQLVAFTAAAEGPAAVRLAWATASEKNSRHFEVERSADGVAFVAIGTVAAAGTTAAPRIYALRDAALPAGAAVLYYRLRQVDLDGTAHYSPVRSVALATGLSLYPNPTAGGAATLAGATPGAPVQVLDAVGRVVATATADATGTAALAAGLAPGVYVVRAGSAALRLVVE